MAEWIEAGSNSNGGPVAIWAANVNRSQASDTLVCSKRPRVEDGDALVVLRWRDWVDRHGAARFGAGDHRLQGESRTSERRLITNLIRR